MIKYLRKGAIVFVHSEAYPPWPAEVERRHVSGLYKVNFYGEKNYTTIEIDKIDIFTDARAKQLIQELNNKQLNKGIYAAFKDL